MTFHSQLAAALLACLWSMAWLARPLPPLEPREAGARAAGLAEVGLS